MLLYEVNNFAFKVAYTFFLFKKKKKTIHVFHGNQTHLSYWNTLQFSGEKNKFI